MRARLTLRILGSVQGVGFRPFVYRLADELTLAGFVNNDPGGVTVEVEGERGALERFVERLQAEHPPAAVLESVERAWVDPLGDAAFRILASGTEGARTVQVLPDLAICADCAREMDDPADRRFGYPFLNCTRCGPRFSIVRSLPYDRPRTTMAGFTMCPGCRAEYEDPRDRRFHAQPTACPLCGPRLALWRRDGCVAAEGDAALQAACDALLAGRVVAVKGLGGFHLMLDARNDEAVARLRAAKPRREKPLALMVGDLERARELCAIDDLAATVLESPAAPIVLLERLETAEVADGVAPNNPSLGLMLPYTPLHRLLLDRLEIPLVATSGNLSDEPICIDERDALTRLQGIADLFLVHDRPIARHVDDSVVRIEEGAPRLFRRARGYAPRPVLVERELPVILAVGAHLKNAVALSVGPRVFVSQHIGDMETPQALEAFERVIDDFLELYEAQPSAIAHDLHPDYASTRWALAAAAERDLPAVAVQHHHAHLASCLIENGVDGPALGAIWDGTGYGGDGTIWGGEFLLGDAADFRRVAHLHPFRLPGGDAAVREPRRTALALLWEMKGGDLPTLDTFEPRELRVLASMLESDVRSPLTSSMGRLFDGIASLTGLVQRTSFEGQAAMALEHVVEPGVDGAYRFALQDGVLDWRPVVEAVVSELARGESPGRIAARFHHGLVEAVVDVARLAGEEKVVLSGGCFQNRLLVRRCVARLREEGFVPLLQRHVPPNDGGIALGQLAVAAARLREL